MITTTDLSKFGIIELKEASEILARLADNKTKVPESFNMAGLHLMFNANSGFVFLTNEDCDVLMLNDDDFEEFITCINCGHEDFSSEFEVGEGERVCPQCKENP